MPDRTEWTLQGQFLTITLPITDPVSDHTHFLYVHVLINDGMVCAALSHFVVFKKSYSLVVFHLLQIS